VIRIGLTIRLYRKSSEAEGTVTADLRSLTRHPGSIRVEEAIDARTPQAAVFAGFFGADLKSSGSPRVWVGAAL